MAKKNKEIVRIEDVELKPQVIGYSYKKKSNIGRVIFIFVALILVVYYINDISLFVNNLLGKNSASVIEQLADESNKDNSNSKEDSEKKELEFYDINNNISVDLDGIKFDSFFLSSNTLSFNITNANISKKIYLETYSSNKTLLERFLIDMQNGSNVINVNSAFAYITIVEKNKNDYPSYTISNEGNGSLTCIKDNNEIVYGFINNELDNIAHTYRLNNSSSNYYAMLSEYQNKVNSYKSMSGITASINNLDMSFTAIISIDLKNANLESINEVYYYGYKEEAKVVKFEMESRGFTCN